MASPICALTHQLFHGPTRSRTGDYTPGPLRCDEARFKAAGYRTEVCEQLHYYPPTGEEAQRTGFDIVELHDGASSTDLWSDYVKWRQTNDPKKALNYRAVAKNIEPGKNPFRAAIDTRRKRVDESGLLADGTGRTDSRFPSRLFATAFAL